MDSRPDTPCGSTHTRPRIVVLDYGDGAIEADPELVELIRGGEAVVVVATSDPMALLEALTRVLHASVQREPDPPSVPVGMPRNVEDTVRRFEEEVRRLMERPLNGADHSTRPRQLSALRRLQARMASRARLQAARLRLPYWGSPWPPGAPGRGRAGGRGRVTAAGPARRPCAAPRRPKAGPRTWGAMNFRAGLRRNHQPAR